MLDLAVQIPTMVGSVLSLFASGSIFICYVYLPPKRHFRHTLILNLAAAGKLVLPRQHKQRLDFRLIVLLDFLNALNNSVTGVMAFKFDAIPQGPPCSANGFIGQLTVQVSTLVHLPHQKRIDSGSRQQIFLFCLFP